MVSVAVNSGSQPTGMKRSSSELDDSEEVDPVTKYLKPGGPFRMDVDRIGFHPDNRGGAGLYPSHAHGVAHDGTDNGVSLRRYKSVEVVKVPADKLEEISW